MREKGRKFPLMINEGEYHILKGLKWSEFFGPPSDSSNLSRIVNSQKIELFSNSLKKLAKNVKKI